MVVGYVGQGGFGLQYHMHASQARATLIAAPVCVLSKVVLGLGAFPSRLG